MCDYCNINLYIKVQQLTAPVLAPLTHADALMDEYTNITGTAFVPLEKRFCPVCGNSATGWNRRAEDTPPQPVGEIECVMCGDTFTEADLAELREMGEAYHREKGCFLCPDCWDTFQRMPLEDRARVALTNGWREVQHEE